MSNYTSPRTRSIDEEIELKIKTIDTIRTCRIKSSERLYKYSALWEFRLFVMNIVSVLLLIISLIPGVLKDSQTSLIISSFFTLYTMIVQYFYSTLNYKERALKYHYHQLELEGYVLELKNIFFEAQTSEMTRQEKYRRYKIVMEKYQISLQGHENHSPIDYRIAKKEQRERSGEVELNDNTRGFWDKMGKFITNFKAYTDFSTDRKFIFWQFPIIIVIVIYYVKVAFWG